MTDVSFVVPVRNDAARLDVCLASIGAERRPDVAIEVLVVDNGSTDGSQEVARRHGARLLEIGEGRVSSLRNQGAAAAEGAVLAFVDADNEIAPGWIAAAIDDLRGSIGAAGALYVPPPRGSWVQRAYGMLRGRSMARTETEWLGSGNVAVRRAAFETIGGFDTTLEACEDVDFCARLRAAGWQLLADPRMGSVHHGDPRSLRALFASERWRGRDNLRVSFRRPIVWSGIPSALISLVDLVLLLAAAGGLAAAVAGLAAGLWVVAGAIALLLCGSLLRVASALRRPGPREASVLQLFAVTLTYDVARALAIVTRAPHRNQRTAGASAS